MEEKIAVIGGGPSGMVAAGFASSRHKNVKLFEKNNKLGKKLFITGKGRCNITNNTDIENFLDNVTTNKDFLYSALYSFTNTDILSLLSNYNLKTKVERGGRVFPVSNKSSDVIKAFEKFLTEKDVNIILNKEVNKIIYKNGFFVLEFKDGSNESFDKIIIATGGKSYPVTGSTGDGYRFARYLGHSIIDLKPALVPCEVQENWVKDIQGLTLKNISISAFIDNKKVYENFGEMLFTHFGITGPIVLTMSNIINKYIEQKRKINFFIDLKPALSLEKLDNRILRDFEKYNNKQVKNGLKDLLPQNLIPIVLKLSGIAEEKSINQITKEERNRLTKTIKNIELNFLKFRPLDEAIVTSGGVSTLEIDPSTMESKLIPGLFFAGEVIDVEALTGGYNLQIAYSTGYLAGINC
ncbi:NAD(P)/FAD-dependent oxidoreductase [Anaerosalibacter bizertensis]|uniref:NAD(P)/FAD-dependent oxidoreductase n=3 Tax=Anaerosalibacter bizertensis TaxID=932217 RepID=A0A844FG24_9FIRM|nr:NAD(P)/FAD-dependent oxidoreductase [Anaerosalibacter bizertensis]MBV1818466.1 NAD(P)/FAD-dependent oxidoreductase [Bacteroidales bacterium MSK.15.36]HHV27713.1 NAD(P)/FAD-dependent oxidoreductase [Tissierellia bacterium]MBU5293206.1 NAD(P)/FAD-dependent oxidoreductase [Anaerosalibacter bizertensis]MCG4564275.1 NAD(P)/FAD-dependent oxidoreductase [Anaerosalibacter bizertensis]MCG4581706.1 NAD(P)/FAD-dependent oxidoreductase [Anaerosalibacter bizertensis]